MNRRTALAAAIFALMLTGARAQATVKNPHIFIYWNDQLDLIIKTQQTKLPRFRRLLKHVDIRPGMSILDIGAGTGQQSYVMAELLNGTGHVYATDIDSRLVDYVNDQAAKRGLKNIDATLVKADGLDDFYTQHTYDLVMVYDVYAFIHDPETFFRQLRKQLNPGAKVIVIADPDSSVGFAGGDFSDWDGFCDELRKEHAGSPFFDMASSILAVVDNPDSSFGGDPLRSALFEMNRIMNTEFFVGFVDDLDFKKSVAFTADEEPYALWLLRRLKLAGIPRERNRMEILMIENRDLVMLNKLLIIQRFRKYFFSTLPHPYLPDSPEARWYSKHHDVSTSFAAAGYRIQKRIDFSPFQDIWIVSEGDSAPTPSADRR